MPPGSACSLGLPWAQEDTQASGPALHPPYPSSFFDTANPPCLPLLVLSRRPRLPLSLLTGHHYLQVSHSWDHRVPLCFSLFSYGRI